MRRAIRLARRLARRVGLVLAGVLVALPVGPAVAQELSSASFRLVGPTLSGGGGVGLESASGAIRGVGVTLGQSTPPGTMTGPSGIRLEGGFWPIVARAAPPGMDSDGDTVTDSADNCIDVPNAAQTDTDLDGIGNLCDCDFTQDGLCNIVDFQTFLTDFSTQIDGGTGTDMDGSGAVGIADFSLFLPGFQRGEPGPSGLVR
jgi:hypothetical protein